MRNEREGRLTLSLREASICERNVTGACHLEGVFFVGILIYVWYLYRVAQLNINQTPEFEDDLLRLMRIRKIATKSEAVRIAVRESLERSLESTTSVNYREWLNLARGEGENPSPKFQSHDEIWD